MARVLARPGTPSTRRWPRQRRAMRRRSTRAGWPTMTLRISLAAVWTRSDCSRTVSFNWVMSSSVMAFGMDLRADGVSAARRATTAGSRELEARGTAGHLIAGPDFAAAEYDVVLIVPLVRAFDRYFVFRTALNRAESPC